MTRAQSIKALKTLISVPRPTSKDSAGDVFHFGIIPSGFFEGKMDRPKEDHRSIALVMGAVLDQSLEGALLKKLPGIAQNNEGYIFSDDAAPLRDLDAKIRMAFALGMFGEKTRADLSLIRVIRNTFAHSRMDINFETTEVSKACDFLTLPERAPTLISHRKASNSCQIFIDVCFQYSLHLITYAEDTSVDDTAASVLDIPPSPEISKN